MRTRREKPRATKARTGAAVVAVMFTAAAGCSGEGTKVSEPSAATSAAPSASPTPTIKATYGTVTELRDALVAAGYECPAWEQADQVKLAAQSGSCSDADVLSVYVGAEDRDVVVATLKEFGGASLLVGENWILNSPEAPAFQAKMGGVVVTGSQ